MSVWMKVPGVTGTCTFPGYETWIALSGFNVRARRSMKMRVGSSSNREDDTPQMSEIAISKAADIASGYLQKLVLDKATAQTVQIVSLRTEDPPDPIEMKTLLDCIFSSYSQTSSGGGEPVEEYRLNFTQITNTTTPMGKTGTPGSPFTYIFDLPTGKCT